MKVFFSGSIRGGRELLSVYEHLCTLIVSLGHEVLSEHVADAGLEKVESLMTEQEIFERDMFLLEQSVCLVAEVTLPSIGVGYEICSAVQKNMPVLCLYKAGSNVSAMVQGNPGVIVQRYSAIEELKTLLASFFQHVNQKYMDNS